MNVAVDPRAAPFETELVDQSSNRSLFWVLGSALFSFCFQSIGYRTEPFC